MLLRAQWGTPSAIHWVLCGHAHPRLPPATAQAQLPAGTLLRAACPLCRDTAPTPASQAAPRFRAVPDAA